MAQHGLGAPESRPEEDTCIIAATFDIDRDRRTWEQTAAIAWAVDAPRRLAPAVVEWLLRDRLRLQRGDVAVSSHYPEEFLLKFESKELCTAALDKGRLRMGDGTRVFIKPWRPLAHALGAAMPFRARLILDGVPAYVWTHSIVERVIGRTCALDVMDERSISMSDTRDIGLWAWTTNPSRIQKVVWLTFTSRAPAGVTISARQPARCLRGATFRVIVHLLRVEDYTSAPLDAETQDGQHVAYSPPTSVFPPCHRGTIDSHAPVSTDDVVIPGEFDSRGTTTRDAPRGRVSGGGAGACREPRPWRRGDDGDDHDGRSGGPGDGRAPRGHGDVVARPRSRSPRRRDDRVAGRWDGSGRRHAADSPTAMGCFRKMGVVAMAEAKVRRVFGGKEADERLALREVVLREAAELRRLIALPVAAASASAAVGQVPPLLLESGTSAPLAVGWEAWSDGPCGALGALSIDDGPPGFGSRPPWPGLASASRCVSPVLSPAAMVDSSPCCDTPGRTPVASPLPTVALLGPYLVSPAMSPPPASPVLEDIPASSGLVSSPISPDQAGSFGDAVSVPVGAPAPAGGVVPESPTSPAGGELGRFLVSIAAPPCSALVGCPGAEASQDPRIQRRQSLLAS
ncbi:hypothetical protein ACQJBY_063929 [Aegilops geniculata]